MEFLRVRALEDKTFTLSEVREKLACQFYSRSGLALKQLLILLKAAIEQVEVYGLPEGQPKIYLDGTPVKKANNYRDYKK